MDAECFDQVFPAWVRHLANVHFTPVAVAARAAQHLAPAPGTRVLDVGAGVGKFCLVGALVTPGTFYGVERGAALVQAARATAGRLEQPRACFLHGDMGALDWRGFDAFYLYNPFADLDGADGAFDACVRFVRAQLDAARPGSRVATSHGYGGELPPGYRLVLEG